MRLKAQSSRECRQTHRQRVHARGQATVHGSDALGADEPSKHTTALGGFYPNYEWSELGTSCGWAMGRHSERASAGETCAARCDGTRHAVSVATTITNPAMARTGT